MPLKCCLVYIFNFVQKKKIRLEFFLWKVAQKLAVVWQLIKMLIHHLPVKVIKHFSLKKPILASSHPTSDVRIRTSRIRSRIRIQTPRIRIQMNPNPPLISWIRIRIQIQSAWIRIRIQLIVTDQQKFESGFESESTPLNPNPDLPFWGLNPNPAKKSLESGFESESAHHWTQGPGI